MKLVSGQLKFTFGALKSTMAIISLSTVIVVTALTLILQKKKNTHPRFRSSLEVSQLSNLSEIERHLLGRMWENRGLDSPGSSWVMLKLLRFKLMNRFPFVPAQLHSAVLQPLSQARSKSYSDKTKPSFPLALPPRLLHNNIYKIAIKMGGDSRTVSVKGTQVIKYQALNPPCNTNSLPAHVFACFKASLKAELHPANSLGSLPHPGCGMSTGVPEALGSSVCSDLLGTNCRGHLGQGTSIWTVPSSQQSREGQPGTALSSLGQRGRQAATEATADPQATRAMGLAPFQAGLAPSVLLPGRKKEFLCCFWREEFSKDNLVCSTSHQTAAAGEIAQAGKGICPLMPLRPCPTSPPPPKGSSGSLRSISLLGGASSQDKKLER